jgi:hypothetical protein
VRLSTHWNDCGQRFIAAALEALTATRVPMQVGRFSQLLRTILNADTRVKLGMPAGRGDLRRSWGALPRRAESR